MGDHKGALGQSGSTCWIVCIEIEFVPPKSKRYTLGPLGNRYQHHLQARGYRVNHKVILDYGMSKVLAMNDIELDMPIPTIESRAIKIL
jgi:hypothetical protein